MTYHLIATCKKELLEIYKCALDAIRPDRLVRNALSFDKEKLVVNDAININRPALIYPLKQSRIHVIGGGKCGLAMAKGLAELVNRQHLTGFFSHGCLSVPMICRPAYETDISLRKLLDSIQVDCKFGAKNNLPDEASVSATESMLNCVIDASHADRTQGLRSLFIVLISGGGSACLSCPDNISLEEKTRIISELVQRGADIVEVNKVRRCFSKVKGGNLARHIKRHNPEAQVLSLIISDVIDDPIEYIASGPTFIRETNDCSAAAMEKILLKYGLDSLKVPSNLDNSTVAILDRKFVINQVIGNNEIALRAAREKAADLGYHVKAVGNNLSGNTREILDRLLLSCIDQNPRKLLVMAGGEATVERLEGETWGIGGRTQEMAIDYMISQLSHVPPRDHSHVDIFLAGSTDGQDGPTDVSGCLASYAEWLNDKGFDSEEVRSAKKNHDSFSFWSQRKPNWLLKFGPTGTNVMDLYFLSLVKSVQ